MNIKHLTNNSNNIYITTNETRNSLHACFDRLCFVTMSVSELFVWNMISQWVSQWRSCTHCGTSTYGSQCAGWAAIHSLRSSNITLRLSAKCLRSITSKMSTCLRLLFVFLFWVFITAAIFSVSCRSCATFIATSSIAMNTQPTIKPANEQRVSPPLTYS